MTAHSNRHALRVVSAGVCCPLGYDLAAAGPAIAANLDAFTTGGFLTDTGIPIPVAAMPAGRLWGAQRLAHWAAWAVRDCLRSAFPDLTVEELARVAASSALLLLTPTAEMLEERDIEMDRLPQALDDLLGWHFSSASRVLPLGEAGLAAALDLASALLTHAPQGRVLIVSADSLLDAQLIERMLEEERVRVPGQARDGLTPGEAAGALLLESLQRDATADGAEAGRASDATVTDFRLIGWGAAQEAAQWNNDIPNRSQGLTAAVRAALSNAGRSMSEIDYRFSDQNGETFLVRDAANAMTRVMAGADPGRSPTLITLADKLGDVGCAAGVVGLAVLHYLSSKPPFRPGRLGLVHLAQDDGLRCAVVVDNLAAMA